MGPGARLEHVCVCTCTILDSRPLMFIMCRTLHALLARVASMVKATWVLCTHYTHGIAAEYSCWMQTLSDNTVQGSKHTFGAKHIHTVYVQDCLCKHDAQQAGLKLSSIYYIPKLHSHPWQEHNFMQSMSTVHTAGLKDLY